jgi:hypothetical protein
MFLNLRENQWILSTWSRAGFIEKGGWDKMPGQEVAGSTVARACVDGLELLAEK